MKDLVLSTVSNAKSVGRRTLLSAYAYGCAFAVAGAAMVLSPARVDAQVLVSDPGAVAAINAVTAAVNAQGAAVTAQLTTLNTSASLLVAQGIVSPTMVAGVTAATTAMAAPLGVLTAFSAGAPAVPAMDATALTLGQAANLADPRFYMQSVAGGASSCISDPSAVGVALGLKCVELQNLRSYRALHASAYQGAMLAAVTAVNTLALIVPLNVADVHLKNEGMSTLKLIQQQMYDLYRAQQDYLQARIEVASEVRQALANKKAGKSRPGGLLGTVLLGTAAKAGFTAARLAAGY